MNISIRLKIFLSLIVILFIMSALIFYITIRNYRKDMLDSTISFLRSNMATLNIAIRNIMIAGEAQLAVSTINELKDTGEFREVAIYRKDGDHAFSDYKTLNSVNRRLRKIKFKRNNRMKKIHITNEYFRLTRDQNESREVLLPDKRLMEFYSPIRNSPECISCHGAGHTIRGVAHFKKSITGVYKRINKALLFLLIIFGSVSIISGIVLILLLRKMIISPLLSVGEVVAAVGEGDFDVRSTIVSKDEIGRLSSKINIMIQGLKERFILSKYVSKSTEEKVKKGGDFVSMRKKVIVLFSDIRGFTAFSEANPPERVVNVLNKILSVQADIVQRFSGDVDNFIGDAIMAIFEDEFSAVRCAYELIQSVKKLNKSESNDMRIGIGISSGEAIAGDIGSTERKKYTIIGDIVNLSSRLSSIAPPNTVLVSEEINNKLKSRIESRIIAGQKIKGKSKTINVYVVQKIHINKNNS